MKPATSLRSRPTSVAGCALLVLLVATLGAANEPAGRPGYAVLGRFTIIDLQRFRTVTRSDVEGSDGIRRSVRLFDLAPDIGAWYLLEITSGTDAEPRYFHLENPYPETSTLVLDPSYADGLVLKDSKGKVQCPLWLSGSRHNLDAARKSGEPFAPLCDGRLFLRNQTKGHKTNIEWVTDFLRDNVWGGETIETFIRRQFFQDAFLLNGKIRHGDESSERYAPSPKQHNPPRDALLAPEFARTLITPSGLGLAIGDHPHEQLIVGRWYPLRDKPGAFVSVLRPRMVAPEILRSYTDRVHALDSVESDALVYSVAFDLDRYDLGYANGTEHPRVGWSPRALEAVRNPSMPGPDGIGNIAPLVATGILNPVDRQRAAAAFAGGFKRQHAAFKWGALALRNNGSHYGVIEDGVVFSTLNPGLATVVVYADGEVALKTWTERDNADLARVRFARQNGVPLIESKPATGLPVPGALVGQWGPGNWSGSEDRKLRSLRAGVCLQENAGARFLIFSYFSTATPSAMARVFQAYGCRYAVHLDMNAPEHAYLAVYHRSGSNLSVEHLIDGMKEVDKVVEGKSLPRFVGYPDNRDFFYLLERENGPEENGK